LIGVNVAVFALEAITGPGLLASRALACWPFCGSPVRQSCRIQGVATDHVRLSSFFLHLAINMYALWMFGSDVERAVGPRHYLILYFASLLSSSATPRLRVSYVT